MSDNTKRISKDRYYLDIAKSVLDRSTCLRRKYGAIIVNNDEIISTGYNGAPRGEQNCIDCGYCERERLNIPKGERYELCLDGETVIKLLNGEYKTIRQLCDEDARDFWVYAIDTNTGKIVPAKATYARVTGHSREMVRVTFDNGKSVVCTPDHQFLMRNCRYKKAEDLKYEDSITPMYYNFARNSGYESICNTISMQKGGDQIPKLKTILKYFDNLDDAIEEARTYNHKVVSVEKIEYDGPVYDLYVPEFNNFAIDLGDNSCIFVHNCVAVHAEQNAIISAARRDMIGGTMYIVGQNVSDGTLANPSPCMICRRLILNSGITRVVGLFDNNEVKDIDIWNMK